MALDKPVYMRNTRGARASLERIAVQLARGPLERVALLHSIQHIGNAPLFGAV
jgi:hypothetical protein